MMRIRRKIALRIDKSEEARLYRHSDLRLVWIVMPPPTSRFHGNVDQSCEFPLLWPRSSLAHFCIVMNASCADPPKLQQRWALSREIHSGAVLLPPLTRSNAAS
jgi:hypothetical protein